MSKFGFNVGYIDELYARFQAHPDSVSPAWQEFFADYRPDAPEAPATATRPAETAPAPAPVAAEPPVARPLSGPSARIAQNMATSLQVPTATSTREIPVKLLEENRRLINRHQERASSVKISFTHLIAFAIARALDRHRGMNAGFREIDGKPHVVPRDEINLGVAIDVERRGERLLLVPNVKNAASLEFPAFVAAYNDLVQRARANKLEVPDFEHTTMTLTNPGMLGTAMSVPRLMAGQGVIVGIGSIGYPAEYAGMAPQVASELGLSKIMTVTSTYDHRIIQGAESGAFLATLKSLLQGEDGFYETVFRQLGAPYEPVAWAGDQNPQLLGGAGATEAIEKQASVLQLIRSYRVRGHFWADLDPLGYDPQPHPELELSYYGLSVWDLDRGFISGRLGGRQRIQTLREILVTLREAYCGHVGVEFMFISDPEPRQWLQERLEDRPDSPVLSTEDQKQILRKLNASEAFEDFLGTQYIGQKRFSLEGAQTLIPMLDFLLRDSAATGIEDVVIGMAHRGRLNVLANTIGKSFRQIFREFEGHVEPGSSHGSGDVKYHLGASGLYTAPDGKEVRVSVASNPSHLEAVDPVVEGMVRARQDKLGDTEHERVLPVLIHGDAAFAGQGVVAETLNLSQLKGYRTGGTVHIVVNNRIGFTTGPEAARSSMYPTDLAKMVSAPILHVNGDQPEEAVRVIRVALAYRQEFKRDVVVDLVCYRRWGHNESDDPSYTHPILYAKIKTHRSVRKLYTEALVRRGDFDGETAEQALEDFRQRMQEVRDEVLAAQQEEIEPTEPVDDQDLVEPAVAEPSTAVDRERLESVLLGLEQRPAGFETHPKLERQLAQRRTRFEEGKIDWALAEALAFGSLTLQGVPVRLSGEDSGRGTFSQRHAVLYDHRTAEPFVPLAALSDDQADFQVFDSLLSEFAVLGFEYGYSVDRPEALVLWEAQFGDFVNGGQVILDQFIASAESKWGQTSALTLLLPHGYEGQGPEHSSARLERFLQLAARGNLRVANPSTPAQYFHLLRHQSLSEQRKPLVVMTPKSLLRHREVVARAEELTGGGFRPVLDDPLRDSLPPARRVVLCSGKVYYDLAAHRRETGVEDVALVRVERLYPFPGDELRELLESHASAAEILWAQEEPSNMGAWNYISERLRQELPEGRSLRYVGRTRNASPATGSYKRHVAVQRALVREAIEGEARSRGESKLEATPG
jgi:2-oxoglutarate dehydrogenase E1 component